VSLFDGENTIGTHELKAEGRGLSTELTEFLQQQIREAEDELRRLGIPVIAWREVTPYLDGVGSLFGDSPLAMTLLGPKCPERTAAMLFETGRFEAINQMLSHAKKCSACRKALTKHNAVPVGQDPLVDNERIGVIGGCQPSLIRRYRREIALGASRDRDVHTMLEFMPAWRAAYTASAAHLALSYPDRPEIMFGAGRFIELQRIVRNLLVASPRAERKAGAIARGKFAERNRPFIESGRKFRQATETRGKAQRDATKTKSDDYQRWAVEIWTKKPHLNKTAVARIIKDTHQVSEAVRTIRKRLVRSIILP